MNGDRRVETNPFHVKSTNPFEDDDIEDDVFLKPSRFILNKHGSDDSKNPFLNDTQSGDVEVLTKKMEIQSKTVASTERSLAHLMESEVLGGNISKELLHQKEQLINCHKKVEDINGNLRNSQRHLRRIRSFFGGFKDFLMGVKIKPVKSTNPFDEDDRPKVAKKSKSTIERGTDKSIEMNSMSHPGMKIRFEEQEKSMPAKLEDIIDNNLGQMLDHVVSLKSLAVNLGEELDIHNDIIVNLNDQAEEAHTSINKQNKEIAKLLK